MTKLNKTKQKAKANKTTANKYLFLKWKNDQKQFDLSQLDKKFLFTLFQELFRQFYARTTLEAENERKLQKQFRNIWLTIKLM